MTSTSGGPPDPLGCRLGAAIEVRGPTKVHRGRSGTTTVLDGGDLTVAAGSITALLGPNGAGETTTVHVLSTLARPAGGSAVVAGCDVVRDPDGVRGAIGLTGQLSAVDTLLTGEQNLVLICRLRRLGTRGVRRARGSRPAPGDTARRPQVHPLSCAL